MKNTNIENKLLATHISDNANFVAACELGDSAMIISIIEAEMQKHKLFTPGSNKLKNDIISMLQGKDRVPKSVGRNILQFVWYSRLSGTGYAVIKD